MHLLEITDLKKGFVSPHGNWSEIIDIERFQLAEAEQLAMKGDSGSGKTTFLNLIAGILHHDGGTISIDNVEITALSESQRDALRARKIGYVFQSFNLLQGFTAFENVMLGMAFGGGANRERADKLLERVGLSDRKDYKPKQLSVGQQQRVAVARALANAPKLVLADEPTGNLDRKTTIDVLGLIREVCTENNASLLLVSHGEEVLEQFENVVDLRDLNRCV